MTEALILLYMLVNAFVCGFFCLPDVRTGSVMSRKSTNFTNLERDGLNQTTA
jgi:hypothetical protein